MVITVIMTVGSRLLLLRRSPDLVAERAGYAEKKDAKAWDRVLMPLIAIYGPTLILVIAGLDRRFDWPPELPMWIEIAGVVLLVLATAFSTWALLVNRFFSGVVRIQHDRGHTMVTEGPYRWVRHPGYVGGVVGDLAIPLMLGSLWALVPGLLTASLVVLRTALEDRKRHRIFGFNNPNPSHGSPNYGYELWLVVGPEVEPAAEVSIREFEGGLYAVARCESVENITATWQQLVGWLTGSKYGHADHQWLEEHVNDEVPVPDEELVLDLYAPIAE